MYLLPCRPKPLPDELFSSWLIRLGNTYRMQFCDFLQMLGLAVHLHNSDIDRLASGTLVRSVCELTGTDIQIGRETLLTRRVAVLHNDRLRFETPDWPWLIPLGRSHRSGAHAGFQFCPACLSSGEPYFRWQWRIAFIVCCPVHRVLLADKCPKCHEPIHASAQGLWGLREAAHMDCLIRIERCRTCQFNLRHAPALVASTSLIERQEALVRNLNSVEEGTGDTAADRFAVLRHIVSLIVGQNLGLEYFRRVVADLSGLERVDLPLPYEPDAEILPFEELPVRSRALALEAAIWLTKEWPMRFVNCARAAKVQYPSLNRNSISVRWFNEIIMAAYDWHDIDVQPPKAQSPPKKRPVRHVPLSGEQAGGA